MADKFCRACGAEVIYGRPSCRNCGYEFASIAPPMSNKSFGVALSLCGVFGVLGLHHFYLKNWLHGLIDLGLFISSFYLIFSAQEPNLVMLGIFLLVLDALHSLYVMYMLVTGRTYDGDGVLVSVPSSSS